MEIFQKGIFSVFLVLLCSGALAAEVKIEEFGGFDDPFSQKF